MATMSDEREHASGEDWFRYGLALEASEEGFWDWDLVAGRVWGSKRWQLLTGVRGPCSPLEAWLERVHAQDRQRLEEQLRAARNGEAQSIRNEHRVQDSEGTWRWVVLRAVVARDVGGRATKIAGSLTDNTPCRMTDPLTGMGNRRFFVEHVERRMERGFRHADWNFAVLSLALDRFDRINETLGSGGGDLLLVETAARIERLLPESSVAARLNGAEFLVCLEMTQGEAEAVRFAAEAAEVVRLPFRWQGHPVKPQLAVGIAQASAWYTHPENLMGDAETALMHARRQEPPGVVSYTDGMRQRALETLDLETELERAIQKHELVMFYQPEVDLRTNRIIGFEALVRWKHERRGLLLPGDFIPMAEQTGLILPLGHWGMMEACRQLVSWRATASEEMRNARMSVNLSARQFEQPDLVRRVEDVLDESGLPPGCLRLEVTESSLIADAAVAQKTMHELGMLGVGLHMDDFGTGYSSLEYLQRFPFDTLKIDRAFVRGIVHDHESHAIVSTILELARSFGMDVVAEGIEQEEQLEELKAMGCPCGQGYYFAKPMEPSAIDALALRGAWKNAGMAVGQA
ncbi:MAG TPA: GGDEF and EAL domain-containing protein [Acidobacteriaceae bacterium]|jgi:diguanylate cyclase (GGDEF)-like protein|nr:GGDEF and EAL domain-containing protein [Acidobacteriaceae bacterium]